MSTTRPVRSSTPLPRGILANAVASMRDFVQRLTAPVAPAAPATGTSDLWQLYRMSRGSDSLRPAVIRMLASGTGR